MCFAGVGLLLFNQTFFIPKEQVAQDLSRSPPLLINTVLLWCPSACWKILSCSRRWVNSLSLNVPLSPASPCAPGKKPPGGFPGWEAEQNTAVAENLE